MSHIIVHFVHLGAVMDPPDHHHIYTWSVDKLRECLRNKGIPNSGVKKTVLQERVFLSLQHEIGTDPRDISVPQSIQRKLILDNGIVRIPDPVTLQNWEIQSPNVPIITQTQVETYFENLKCSMGIVNNCCEALRLGKGLLLSSHVGPILFNAISCAIRYCFIKCFVVRQTSIHENPHMVWALLDKDTGSINAAYCSCPSSLNDRDKSVSIIILSVTLEDIILV